jgi:hypothetical protein
VRRLIGCLESKSRVSKDKNHHGRVSHGGGGETLQKKSARVTAAQSLSSSATATTIASSLLAYDFHTFNCSSQAQCYHTSQFPDLSYSEHVKNYRDAHPHPSLRPTPSGPCRSQCP